MIQDYLDQLIVVGDRLIIELSESSDRTDSGLYLPPNVKEKEEIQSGYVLK
ncbi:MAG: co-chaperone GroES, partial [Bacteroidota bacterium]|nr:co-chaperone GroES [Bacteroidota bacterium]